MTTNRTLYLLVPPLGIGAAKFDDDFFFMPERPARHCKICGASYQPELARSPNYNDDEGVRLAVDLLLKEWATKHNSQHSKIEHIEHIKSGRFMTPEAAVKLIPLGIYPVADLTFDTEVIQAGFEAKRAPSDDVPDQ